jgi:glycine/D-amino acid oxidase-like deaminating enzyme
MDLRSNAVLWPAQDGVPHAYQALEDDIECDVCIVGGGVIGALLAYTLSEKGISVALVEKAGIASGSTSASTALLMYNLDVNLSDLVKKIGKARAVRAYRLSRKSVLDIKRLIEKLGIKCDFHEKKVLYLASKKGDMRSLEAEHTMFCTIGFKSELLDEEQLMKRFGICRPGALVCHTAAEIDPFRFAHALVWHAKRKGARIYAKTEVKGYVEEKNGIALETTTGHMIKARKVVFATGYESTQYLKKRIVNLKSTYVIASRPIPGLKKHFLKDYLVWETAHPYLYVRTTDDNRILVGGEDIATVNDKKRDALISKKAKTLQKKFGALIDDVDLEIACAWAGTFGETKSGLGYIGAPKGSENTYFALGFGGNGVSFGMTAADMLLQMLRGKKSKDQRLFSFERKF